MTKPKAKLRAESPIGARVLDVLKPVAQAFGPECLVDFRDDVQSILENWDGRQGMLWFAWEEGTFLFAVGPEPERNARLLAAAKDMARGGRCFRISADGAFEKDV